MVLAGLILPSSIPSLSGVPLVPTDEICMLGVPLGSKTKNAAFIQKLFSRLDSATDKLKEFDDSQSAFYLLLVSFSIVRATHFMRTTPLDDWVEESADFDLKIRTAAETILGFVFEDESSYPQACLTPSLGGFGLRRTAVHAGTAYAASFLEARAESGESWTVPTSVLSSPPSSQKVASYQIDKKIHARLVEQATTRREKKRLERITEPHAGVWTAVPSTEDGFDTITKPQVFRIKLRTGSVLRLFPMRSLALFACKPLIYTATTLRAAKRRGSGICWLVSVMRVSCSRAA